MKTTTRREKLEKEILLILQKDINFNWIDYETNTTLILEFPHFKKNYKFLVRFYDYDSDGIYKMVVTGGKEFNRKKETIPSIANFIVGLAIKHYNNYYKSK